MKKGINIWSFPQGSIKDSLTLAKKAGFEGVELALGAEGELSMTSTESEIKEIKKLADDMGMALYSLSCGLCWDYRLSDDDPALRQKAKDMIKKQLETAKIPYVLLQRKPSEHLSHFVQSDDFEGGYLAAKHLYTLGHRAFLLIFPSLLISSAQERYHGFLSYLRENGVSDSAVSVLECDGTRDSGYEALHTWLAEHTAQKKLHTSAVFCFSDYVAAGVYSAIKKFGLHIPDDLSVIGLS